MDQTELSEALTALGLSPRRAAEFLSVDIKTVTRWLDGSVAVPGPTKRALEAWLRFDRMGLPWRPDEVAIGMIDEDQIAKQIALMRKHVIDLDEVIQRVRKRGGAAAPWKVDLAHHEAILADTMRVSFYSLDGGLFSPSTYMRTDKKPVFDRDRPLIEDAIACIAEAIKAAGPNWIKSKRVTKR